MSGKRAMEKKPQQSKTSNSLLMSALEQDGILANTIENFRPRAPQQEMAIAIETAIANQEILVVEAGTGTGKTFAYLIPALLSGKKTIISTGTKNLQDQLFLRDLPRIKRALKSTSKIALLKGRANYLCLQRLEYSEQNDYFENKILIHQLQKIKTWSNQTHTGDLAELIEVNEDSPILSHVTSSADNCLGQDCEFYEKCYLVKARRRAQEADILVVNHHLYFADLNLRDSGFGEILPGHEVIIFDEAHQIPEIASQFFGDKISSRQLSLLANDVIVAQMQGASDMPALADYSHELLRNIKETRLAFGELQQKNSWDIIKYKPHLQLALEKLSDNLTQLNNVLDKIKIRSTLLENSQRRTAEMLQKINLLTTVSPASHVHWFQTFAQSFTIYQTPLSIAEDCQQTLFAQPGARIFTSATLAVGTDFNHFTHELGMQNARTLQLASPFDYAQQALLYIPSDLPDPNHEHYLIKLLNAAIPVINAAEGRTFFLFTSHRALKSAAEMLTGKIKFPLLIQSSMPKAKLLDEFRRLGNAVLLGTSSFWEGVDVRGEALSCVIIDKLPFAMPDDPVLKARLNVLKQQQQDPFYVHQLPHAVISLKQGSGRLIRDQQDYGVLMIGDPRLYSKNYGKVFLDSLPDMKRTRNLDDVVIFFETLKSNVLL